MSDNSSNTLIKSPGIGEPLLQTPSIQKVSISLEIYSLSQEPPLRLFSNLPASIQIPLRKSLISSKFEELILSMKLNETREIKTVYSQYFPPEFLPQSITEETPLKICISILEAMEKSRKNPWDLDSDMDRLDEANSLKLKGNEALKNTKYNEANLLYTLGLNLTELDTGKSFEDIRLLLSSNLILGFLKAGDAKKAKEVAEKALEEEPKHVKIRYRKALAEIALGEFVAAKDDLVKANELEPDNKEILQELGNLKEKEKSMKEKQKAVFSKMFGK